MDRKEIKEYIENSFLAPLLKKPNVTDISFNGKDIYYVDNNFGRQKYQEIIAFEEVKNFIRQLANVTNNQFSYANPILDITIDKYRICAIHSSICKMKECDSISFSVRIRSDEIKINDESLFITKELASLTNVLIKSHVSIVIGGNTGTGKTEFQRYLFSKMEENSRVIIIDNVQELENVRNEHLDITCWQIDDRNENTKVSSLVKAALRNNPDWLIISEIRGSEMIEIMNGIMTGLPIITTIHSLNIESIQDRVIGLIINGKKDLDYESIKHEIQMHIHFYIYLKKRLNVDGRIDRYIDSIIEVDDTGVINYLYNIENNEKKYNNISKKGLKFLNSSFFDSCFINNFGGNL